MVRYPAVSIPAYTLFGFLVAWHFFGEIGLPVLYSTLASLAINVVGHLIQRERMQHYGYLPQASADTESAPDDLGGRS
ncbi:hypothetical protein [Streptomyces olivochromogenes]|uniref:hypothetical protein n=1 Tax=Streptomyces olivochromogenes TaxID=1963 RepID=UPI001F40331E|nr:hypothetical protein [Streptomyces olivochromogenes]MCF3136235.1 hypothetical protein [Streptomyces olivochromogenes]